MSIFVQTTVQMRSNPYQTKWFSKWKRTKRNVNCFKKLSINKPRNFLFFGATLLDWLKPRFFVLYPICTMYALAINKVTWKLRLAKMVLVIERYSTYLIHEVLPVHLQSKIAWHDIRIVFNRSPFECEIDKTTRNEMKWNGRECHMFKLSRDPKHLITMFANYTTLNNIVAVCCVKCVSSWKCLTHSFHNVLFIPNFKHYFITPFCNSRCKVAISIAKREKREMVSIKVSHIS